MYAYHFSGYWKDVGTISSLWEANMEVLDPKNSGIDLFDEDWKIYSRNSGMTGHKIGSDAVIKNSMITDGCRIDGEVEHSVLFAGVKVAPGAVVKDAVVMGGTVIKPGAVVEHCIIGENAAVYHAGEHKVDQTVTACKRNRSHQPLINQFRDKRIIVIRENNSQCIYI